MGLLGLSACGGGGTDVREKEASADREDPEHIVHDPAKTLYRITRFAPPGSDSHGLVMNSLGHVAGSYRIPGGSEGGFLWDGSRNRLFSTPSGRAPVIRDVNRSDRMAGYFEHQRGDGSLVREAFTWSKVRGFVRLAPLSIRVLGSQAHDVNDLGQIVGTLVTPRGEQGFMWSLETGLVTRFGRATHLKRATHINNSGFIAGVQNVNGEDRAVLVNARTGERRFVAPSRFRGGPVDLRIEHLNDRGEVAGTFEGQGRRAFFSEPLRGSSYVDVGAAVEEGLAGKGLGEFDTFVTALNEKGETLVNITFGIRTHYWSRATGFSEIQVDADYWVLRSINKHGVAVGAADGAGDYAISWSRKSGEVQLVTRIQNRPPELRLRSAHAINDNGQILAVSDSVGPLLLTPIVRNGHAGH